MKLRVELLDNKGRRIIAKEKDVAFNRSIWATVESFTAVSRFMTVEMVYWLSKNQDEFVRILKGK